MITNKFPYAGFGLSWHFHGNDYDANKYDKDLIMPSMVYEDIYKVLTITSELGLLFPTYIDDSKTGKIYFKSNKISDIILELREIINTYNITYQIDTIGGYGIVYTNEKEFEYQEDLILLKDIRFFERLLCIYTYKSVWVCLNFDQNYHFEWQLDLARLNGFRLESCLRKIYDTLKIDVTPAPDELDRDEQIWQKGFKLYVNPTLISHKEEEYPEGFSLENYIREIYEKK